MKTQLFYNLSGQGPPKYAILEAIKRLNKLHYIKTNFYNSKKKNQPNRNWIKNLHIHIPERETQISPNVLKHIKHNLQEKCN